MKKSAVNGHLFWRDLRRAWPVWGGASFIYVVFYIARFLTQYTRQLESVGHENINLYMSLNETARFIAIADFLLVLVVFGFVNNSRSANFFFSMPLSRESLFLTKLAACLTAAFVPAFIAGLVPVLVSGGLEVAWFLMLQLMLAHVFFLGMALLCMSMLGQSVAYAAIAFIFQFLGMVIISFSYSFIRMILYGLVVYRYNYSLFEEILNPMQYFAGNDGRESFTTGFILAGLGIVFGVIAFIAFKKRDAESAGDIIAFKFLRPVFKYGVAACSAMFFTMIMMESFNIYAITFRNLAAVCFMIVISTAIGYFTAEMLIHKKFNVFKKSFGGFAVAAAVLVGVMCFVKFDVLGLEKRVPNIDDIEWVSVEGGMYDEREDIENVIALHEFLINGKEIVQAPIDNNKKGAAILTSVGEIVPLDEWQQNRYGYGYYADRPYAQSEWGDEITDLKSSEYLIRYIHTRYPFSIQMQYYLKNGKSFIRNYVNRELLKDEESTHRLGELYSVLTHTYAFAANKFPVMGDYGPGQLRAMVNTTDSDEERYISVSLESNRAERLYAAVRADMINLNIGVDEAAPLAPERPATLMADSITVWVDEKWSHGYNSEIHKEIRQHHLFSIYLDTRAANTLALLMEWGIEVK
jgi:hypothetical protein